MIGHWLFGADIAWSHNVVGAGVTPAEEILF